jgi:hypothetical protein
MVTAAVPLSVKITDCAVAAVFTATLPKATLAALTVRVGTDAFNSTAKLSVTLPAVAVRLTEAAELTEDTVAVKVALAAPAGAVTVAGTVIAPLLLPRLMVTPPLGAAAFRVTVQTSVPEPVIVPLPQLNPLSTGTRTPLTTGTAVPLRPTTAVGLVEELLVMVSCPEAAPETAGLNCTLKAYVPPAATVAGSSPWPLTTKDCPVTFSWEIWIAAEL